MSNPRGPVVVGMDIAASETAVVQAAIDLAAREAVRRQVELRLVYGHVDLPPWPLACQILDDVTARAAEAFPTLAITTAIFPGTATAALVTASASASLIVATAQTYLDDGAAIADLTTGAMFNAPVVVVLEPISIDDHREEPAFVFSSSFGG